MESKKKYCLKVGISTVRRTKSHLTSVHECTVSIGTLLGARQFQPIYEDSTEWVGKQDVQTHVYTCEMHLYSTSWSKLHHQYQVLSHYMALFQCECTILDSGVGQ